MGLAMTHDRPLLVWSNEAESFVELRESDDADEYRWRAI